MGITSNCAKFLFFARKQGVSYSETVMLGRQQLYVTKQEIKVLVEKTGLDGFDESIFSGQYAEPLFSVLGASSTESLDVSPYEKATIIHDLNFPVSDSFKKRFSVVFDGGTLEHVFNFPVAVKNCMDMLAVGGHFISITPANNQCGHGFYQFSPELYFSVFSKEAGFKVKTLLLAVDVPGRGIREWYEVMDPQQAKSRVTISNSFPTYIMVLAQKVEHKPLNDFTPYQSDYTTVWSSHDTVENEPTQFKKIYKKIIPLFIRDTIYRWRKSSALEKDVAGLGIVNPLYFKKVKE